MLTDTTLQRRYSHAQLAELACRGGASVVQWRQKEPITDREAWMAAAAVAAVCKRHGVACVLNDRADFAAASGADGVHLGRQDLPPGAARRVLGPDAWVGLTVNNEAQLAEAQALPVDYLGIGPVFGTRSKASPAPALGLERFAAMVAQCTVPVIAIGSVSVERVAEVCAAGAYGIAVLSGVTQAPDPELAARRYAEAIDRALGGLP